MKKTSLFAFIFLLLTNSGYSQWPWAKQIGSIGPEYGDIKFSNNSLFISTRFGSICHLDTSLLIPNGWGDMFLAKYDLSGNNRQWVKSFGGNNPSNLLESGSIGLVTTDAIYYIGAFYDAMTIDGLTVSSSGGQLDAFIAKFDMNGTCQWIRETGGGVYDGFYSMDQDSSGDLYISYFNPGPNIATIDTHNLTFGLNIIKMNAQGQVLSVVNNLLVGSTNYILKIKNNELYLAGQCGWSPVIIGTDTLDSMGTINDIYLVKMDLNCNFIWGKRFGGFSGNDFVSDLTFDYNNNLYLVGTYKDTLDIDNFEKICTSNAEMFLAKFDMSGVCQWVQSTQSINSTSPKGISVSINNSFYITGVSIDETDFGNYHLSSQNPQLFLTRYNTNGDCLGVQTFNGSAIGHGVAINPIGEPFVYGIFEDTINIGSNSFVAYSRYDFFIAKADIIDGVSENRVKENQLVIYANPSSGNFRIQVPTDLTTLKNAVLVIYDAAGKIIAKFPIENEHPHFEIPESTPGTYVIKLYQGDKSYSGRLVVE